MTIHDATDGRRAQDEETTALAMALAHRRVKTDQRDLPVETMVQWVLRGTLTLQPAFQREYVWDHGKASRLIESLVLQIPIPVIYVAEEAEGSYAVVDGQQRLTSLVAYITGTFPDGKAFRLSGLAMLPELHSKLFKELPRTYQAAILTASLRVIIITQDSDPAVKFEMFERLNLGAVQLTAQELRNSMYHGTYNTLLRELATHPTLLKIRGATQPHKRMADCQLILRFFAMCRQSHVKYKAPMKHFLNREMADHRNPSSRELATMRTMFDKAIEMAYSVFGLHAFRRFNAGRDAHPDGDWEARELNVALWDTVLYTFSFYEKRQIMPIADAIAEEFLDLMTHDATFIAYITSTTDNRDRVFYRAETWRQRLQQLVASPEPRRFSRALKQQWYDADPTCGICGQHIRGLDDAEADHILHYWRGGKTLPDNSRLGHRPQPQRRRLPITQAAQGQPPPSGGQRWLRQAAATERW